LLLYEHPGWRGVRSSDVSCTELEYKYIVFSKSANNNSDNVKAFNSLKKLYNKIY
jgi:hypothetical protein